MTRTYRITMVLLVAAILGLAGVGLAQQQQISDLREDVDREHMEALEYAIQDGAFQACVSDKLADLQAGVTTTTQPGEAYPC